MDFTGKTAISTGAASGMGLLFAQNWVELGGNVVLCDVNEKVLNEKVEEIKFRVPKGKKAVIKEHAESRGESVNAFLLRAAEETRKSSREAERANGCAVRRRRQ